MEPLRIPSSEEIDVLAGDLLFDNGVVKAPVPLKRILEALDLPLREQPGLEDAARLMSLWGETWIAVRAEDSLVRKRFSVAHEIGHFVLFPHVVEGDHLKPLRARRNELPNWNYDAAERAADRFGACLLMPRDLVQEAADRGLRLDRLARLFQVSREAMGIRLRELGLDRIA